MKNTPAMPKPVSRRWILKAIPTAAAGMMVYACAPDAKARFEGEKLNSFVEFTRDGRTILTCPEAEMGQDVFTGLAKVLADEIGLDWAKVEIVRAPHHKDFYNGPMQSTGGSRSMRTRYRPLRDMGARIRLAFINAAATRLNVAPDRLRLKQSTIIDAETATSLAIEQLLDDVVAAKLPKTAPLKAAVDLHLIGRDVARKDIPAKVTGKAQYAMDVRVPGQLYASVKMIPKILGDASVGGMDEAKAAPGVVGVERLGNAVAVVAKTWWAAKQASQMLALQPFAQSATAALDDVGIDTKLDAAIADTFSPLPVADDTIQATYSAPYLAHMCMETMAATVSLPPGKAQIWVSTQAPSRFANHAAKTLGLDIDNVTVENMFLGGGFGRKGTDLQALDQAITLAQRYGKPIQVAWDRQTDIVSDQYRPAAKFTLAARLTPDAGIAEVRSATATQSLAKALMPQLYRPGGNEFPSHGFFPYQTEKADHRWIEADLAVAIGFWRSVSGSHYPFASESFIDELAHKASQDPLTYRLARMEDNPRLRAVLEKAADMADWTAARPDGTGLGIGMFEEWGSVCAQVAEVSQRDGRITVNKVWAALDCGLVVSPDTVRAQVTSAVHCGLSAALFGQVHFENGQALQSNFHDYQLIDMTRSPTVDVEILSSDLPPGGVGEIGTPPTAPAVANAIFAATGQRIRSLPLDLSVDI